MMAEWVASHTLLVLLCIAGAVTAVWAVAVLIRSRWLDEYGRKKE